MVQVATSDSSDDDDTRTDLKLEAYKTISTAMMSNPVPAANPIVALNLLETALYHRNVPLAKYCINNLNDLIHHDDVLRILPKVSKWSHMPEGDQHLNYEPSAPPLVDNREDMNENWMKEPMRRLRENILLEIDKRGDHFLKQKDILNLPYQDVLDITTRDTLQVSSELVVYCAVMDWATHECKNRGVNTDVIKVVLNELIYAPRYGLMTKKQFRSRSIGEHRGPDRIGLPTEVNEQIMGYIVAREKKKKVEELPFNMSKQRVSIKPKDKEKSPAKEKAIINFLTCFSAIFD